MFSLVVTLVILAFSMFFFVQGKIRSDIVALVSLVLLMVFGVVSVEEALAGFSNSIVLMMLGLFIVGGAVFRTGLARVAGQKIVKVVGKNEDVLFVAIMLVTGFIGAFVGITGTAALMLPIVMSVSAGTRSGPKRFLMPMAFGCSLGGLMTLIGTPPNMVVSDALVKAGYPALKLFSFTPIGFFVLLLMIAAMFPASRLLCKKKDVQKEREVHFKSLRELTEEYSLSRNVTRVRVQNDSPIVGRSFADLKLPNTYNLTVIEIERPGRGKFFGTSTRMLAGPSSVSMGGDILFVLGDSADVKKFAEEMRAPVISAGETGSPLHFRNWGIAEVLLMPDSSLVNRNVLETNFRAQFGVNVLGIQRKGAYILHDLKDVHLESRDTLLVQGAWENIRKLSASNSEWVVLGEPLELAESVPLDHKMPFAAAILLLMVILMVSNAVPPVAAVFIAALLMILSGCFRNVEDAYSSINWESTVLIAAMLPMSTALEKTGISGMIAKELAENLGALGPYALLAGIYYTTSLVTIFISNTATAVLLAPIAMSAAAGLGVSPYPFLFAVTVSASCCFISPFSTPPNALVMNAGRYVFRDYLKIGGPLQIAMGVVMTFVLPLFFPF